MEAGTIAFEDIHAVAARIAARKLTRSQNSDADREARSLARTVRAPLAQVKVQIQRIGFINEAAKLIGDDCFGFHLAMETDTRELGIIHYIFSASGTALDAIKNFVRYNHLVNTTTSLVIEETNRHVTIDVTFRPGLEGFEKHIAEWGMTTFVAALRHLTNTHIVPPSVSFIHRRNTRTKEFNVFFWLPGSVWHEPTKHHFRNERSLSPDTFFRQISAQYPEGVLRRCSQPTQNAPDANPRQGGNGSFRVASERRRYPIERCEGSGDERSEPGATVE